MRRLHRSSTSELTAAFKERKESTSLHSNIIKWREGIPRGCPSNENNLEYWELIGPMSSSPLFMTTYPTSTSFLTTPPPSVSFRRPVHISHSAVGSLVHNVGEQFQSEDLETCDGLDGTGSSDEYARSDFGTECTVVDDSRMGFGPLLTLVALCIIIWSLPQRAII
ncbi:uncharacterized protein BT62DRAFT_794268 [Guyanagaster necrorhizus]|uniref:Uncharacterized protein n=1 Tax=Guyanagaster necrorhizus TaxID=856835 RepID=A0A9P7VWF9_9AGAR|nr:uncharacterized protein BT62DRAFT_794268 [Guyanagaster necrorhizus MCA 3950]KAG7447807.1 hypothetical protein BT62DRAFT_794268 [Guyanagaster necrorhizus MCA 3950]